MVGLKKPFRQGSSANAATGAGGYGGFPKPKSDSSKRMQSDSSAAPKFGSTKTAGVKTALPRPKPAFKTAVGGPKTSATKPKMPKGPASPFGGGFKGPLGGKARDRAAERDFSTPSTKRRKSLF